MTGAESAVSREGCWRDISIALIDSLTVVLSTIAANNSYAEGMRMSYADVRQRVRQPLSAELSAWVNRSPAPH
jgi:hypothetical protein